MTSELQATTAILPAVAPADEPTIIAYAIQDAPAAAGVNLTKIYDAIRAKELTARKCGRNTIVEADELRRWIKTLPPVTLMPPTPRPTKRREPVAA